MKIMPISACAEELQKLNQLLSRPGRRFPQLLSALHYLAELRERRAEICIHCRHYDHGCTNAQGLLNAHDGDYCSRWTAKPAHEIKEE